MGDWGDMGQPPWKTEGTSPPLDENQARIRPISKVGPMIFFGLPLTDHEPPLDALQAPLLKTFLKEKIVLT